MPYFIAANAVPIIAFAPITNAWFGTLTPGRRWSSPPLCFFPVLVNTLRGLTSVHPSSIELMRSYAAGNAAIFRRVRVPTALPYLFSSLKVASVLAMIGAIVGEYFGGSQEQLGILIKNSAALFQFETAWAAILVACILGIAFYLAVSLVERVDVRLASIGAIGRLTGGDVIRFERDTTKEGRWMKESMGHRAAVVAVVAVAPWPFVTLSGSSPAAAKLTKVTLQLKWVTQAQFAGYYAAKAKGYYKDVRARRDAQARRARHHAGAGRRLRAGGVRHRLAALAARDA